MSVPTPTIDLPKAKSNEAPWWKEFVPFGDYHADTHEFIETAAQRAPKEIGCALAASLLVSPLVSIIDKCIVQEIGGTAAFMTAIGNATKEMIYTPKTFFGGLSFRMTAAVYFGTYAVANLSELALDVNKVRGDDKRKTLKVSAASVANISLLAWRDTVFAREFGGANAPKKAAPMRTIGLFATRDAATMYATFYAAPRAAEYLQDNAGVERNVSELSCAIAVPVFTQIVTAPIHIHAMDFYNKPDASTADRMATIKKEFGTVSFARGLRILPAFGIGSFSNNKFRENFIRQPDETKLLKRRVTDYVEAKLGRKITSR
jgi:hypothetical protein